MVAKWLLRCDDVYDQAARVANQIWGLVHNGARFGEIVVVLADFEDSVAVYKQTFEQYGVAVNVDVGVCLMDTPEAKRYRDELNKAPWISASIPVSKSLASAETRQAPEKLQPNSLKQSSTHHDLETGTLVEIQKVLDTIKGVLGEGHGIEGAEFCNMFCTLCTAVKVSNVPTYADRVLVVSAKEYEPSFAPYVFVCGANDGVFPARVDDTDILTEQDIRAMSIRIEPTATQQGARARRAAQNILASATTAVYLVYGDLNSRGERARVSGLCKGFTDLTEEAVNCAQFARRVAFNMIGSGEAFENAEVGRRVAGLCEASGAGNMRVAEFAPVTGRISDVSMGGATVGGQTEGLLPKGSISITALEKYADCPFKYYVENVLGLEKPEPLGGVDVRAVGTVLHGFAENFVKTGERDVRPLLVGVRLPRFVRGAIVRQCKLIAKFLEKDIAESEVKPKLFEQNVTGEICGVSVRGKADRVDVGERGFVVVDYKTGGAGNVRLQLPLYMKFLAGAGVVKGGGSAGVPLGSYYLGLRDFKKKMVGVDEIEESVERAEALIEDIKAGRIDQEPMNAESCEYCIWRDSCGGRHD